MSLVLLRIFFRSPILRRRRIRDVIPRAPDVMPPIVFWLRIGRRITCEHKLIFTDQIFSKKTAIAIAVAGGLYIVYKILALLMKSRGQPPRETPTERRAEGSPHSDTSASRRCIGRRDVSLFGETWGGHRADDEGAEGVLNHECVGEPWTPPRLPPRTTQLGILRRQCRQFQLSSLAAELTHLLEHLSSPSVPANAFVPPRIVRGNNMCDRSTQTSPDLNSRHGCSCFPDTTPQFSPCPSHWSPTDYSPTSPVALPSHRAPVPSPGFGPSCSFMSPAHASVSSPGLGPSYSYMSPAAAEARTPCYFNKDA
ncbi:hypothetical protein C0J45_8155 [Silurus meridionalis]|nr:hypothetical protein C0J45_8155 [Silurus meridionalis]